MRTTLGLLILMLIFSVCVFAQDDDEINRNEFYAGYLNKRDDDGIFSNGAHGYNVGYTRNIAKYVGLRGEFAGTFKNTNFDTLSINGPVNFDTKASFYTFHAGVQIKDNTKSGKLKPFAHALVGVGHNRAQFRCTPSSNCLPEIISNTTKQTGFSAGLGGGLDLRINDRVDVRLVQAEFNPLYLDGRVINSIRFGVGVVIK